MLLGPPPKCIWLRLGNCSTADIAILLEKRANLIRQFQRGEARLLILDAHIATTM